MPSAPCCTRRTGRTGTLTPPTRIMTIDGLSNTARNNIRGRNARRLFGIHKLPEPARRKRVAVLHKTHGSLDDADGRAFEEAVAESRKIEAHG
jgi:hypothetical protein